MEERKANRYRIKSTESEGHHHNYTAVAVDVAGVLRNGSGEL